MKFSVIHNGVELVGETKRKDVTHVFVGANTSCGGKLAIMGMHSSKAHAEKLLLKTGNPWIVDRAVYEVESIESEIKALTDRLAMTNGHTSRASIQAAIDHKRALLV